MGLLNDVRFYLMVALAILFLIVMAMCSSAYDTGTDRHADAGVGHSDSQAAEDSEEMAAESTAQEEGEATETQSLVSNTETAEEAATEEVTTEEAVTEEVAVATEETTESTDAAAQETTAETNTEEMTEVETEAVMVEVSPFELSPLADSGQAVPDLQSDIGNLKTDFGRFTGRVDGATGMFEKVKEAIGQ